MDSTGEEAMDIARPFKRRCLCSLPQYEFFAPEGAEDAQTLQVGLDEYEVLRLIDYVCLSQAQCAARMGISRATVARLYGHARSVVAEALVLGKRIQIAGGDVTVCERMKPECIDEPFCCHRQQQHNNGGMNE